MPENCKTNMLLQQNNIQIAFDSKYPLINCGFVHFAKNIFQNVTETSYSDLTDFTPTNTGVNLIVLVYDDNIETLKNQLKNFKKSDNTIVFMLVVSGELNGLTSFVADGVSGFLELTSTDDNFKEAISKTFNNQNYYFARLWDHILEGALSVEETPKQLSQLTRRENDVMTYLLKGISTQKIGETLGLSPHTVQTHRKHIFKKMSVSSLSELILKEKDNVLLL